MEREEGPFWDQDQSRFGCIMFESIMNYLKGVIGKAAVGINQVLRGQTGRYKFGGSGQTDVRCGWVSK